jgi:hypothetical protein
MVMSDYFVSPLDSSFLEDPYLNPDSSFMAKCDVESFEEPFDITEFVRLSPTPKPECFTLPLTPDDTPAP